MLCSSSEISAANRVRCEESGSAASESTELRSGLVRLGAFGKRGRVMRGGVRRTGSIGVEREEAS